LFSTINKFEKKPVLPVIHDKGLATPDLEKKTINPYELHQKRLAPFVTISCCRWDWGFN
jgi:hypothetical protein